MPGVYIRYIPPRVPDELYEPRQRQEAQRGAGPAILLRRGGVRGEVINDTPEPWARYDVLVVYAFRELESPC